MFNGRYSNLSRRCFIKSSAVGGLALWAGCSGSDDNPIDTNTGPNVIPNGPPTQVALVKTSDRKDGVTQALQLLDYTSPNGKNVLLKPNYNTAADTPASTHNDTLTQLIAELQNSGAASITVGESSYRDTNAAFTAKGVFDLADDMGFSVVNFDNFPDSDWVHINRDGFFWDGGFYVPRMLTEAEYVVNTCCLKTHQYGGNFTMSLKNSIGFTKKYNGMRDNVLHGTGIPIRYMIAETNTTYEPDLIVIDGVNAFITGGPNEGDIAEPNVIIAGTDRIAVDAVGIAVLKDYNAPTLFSKIFEQGQIKRAVELNLGINTPGQIEFVTPDEPSRLYAEQLEPILAYG